MAAERTPITTLIAAGMVSFLALVFYFSPVGEFIQNRFARPAQFRFRNWVGRDPLLDPRVRIYALDDSTLQLLGDEDLSLDEWASVIETFAPSKPRAVFIDKVFGTPKGMDRAGAFVERLQRLDFPVIAGAFIYPHRIASRSVLPESRPEFALAAMLEAGKIRETHVQNPLSWLSISSGHPYGPKSEIVDAFAFVGHLLYDNDYHVRSFARLSDRHAIPYAGILAANERYIDDGQLFLDGSRVPLDRSGRILVNFAAPEQYAAHTYSLSPVLQRARLGEPTMIREGSVVLILPAMFTGNTDMLQTPFGIQPGGHIIAAVMNSVVTGRWLSRHPSGLLLVFVGVILGLMIARLREGSMLAIGLLLCPILLVLAGLFTFSHYDTETPWWLASLLCFSSSTALTLVRVLKERRALRKLRTAMSGVVSPERLKEILSQPSTLSLEPIGRVVSIMFIDIVDFSVLAERLTPEQAFLSLRELMGELTRTIHEEGGVVDKSTGDGLLCYFGYHYDGGASAADHADRALACAIKIQRERLRKNLEAKAAGTPIFTLRIGINSAGVYLGNLGGGDRLDLTLIGHGVNLAKRLEGSCRTYRILLGTATREMMLNADLAAATLVKTKVEIKHSTDLLEVFECDPFADKPELLSQALELHRKSKAA